MTNETIQTTLQQRFAAPRAAYQDRRIIFWQDPDREFESVPETLDLPGVNVVKLTGTNSFAVKKLLLHDDLQGDYLVYDPFAGLPPEENWLRDLELTSEEFRADLISMQLTELGIEPSVDMRKTVRLFGTFLQNKERVARLKALGHRYTSPLQFHIDVFAILTGARLTTVDSIIIAILEDGLDDETNTALSNIASFGVPASLWQLISRRTGYNHFEDRPIADLAAHILVTALAHDLPNEAVKGLENYISPDHLAHCFGIFNEWRDDPSNRALYSICTAVEDRLRLADRFADLDVETLLRTDVFPGVHRAILHRFFSETSDGILKADLMLQTIADRRVTGWYQHFRPYYDCLENIGRLEDFHRHNLASFALDAPREIWDFYISKACKVDTWYRHFHRALARTISQNDPVLEDPLKQAADQVEHIYAGWFLQELNACWANAIAKDLATIGKVSDLMSQTQTFFYNCFFGSSRSRRARSFVIISDALRYEVAAELNDHLLKVTNGTTELRAVQSIFPSITKFGMAALLPHNEIQLNDKMEVLIDGQPTRSTAERNRVLQAFEPRSLAIQATDLLQMKQNERRQLIKDIDIVYIYHNTIDAIGDKPPTEHRVFEACEDTIREIHSIVSAIIGMNGTDIYITADHGFLYTYNPLHETSKLSSSSFHGEVYESGRRYAITAPDCEADYLLPVAMDRVVKGQTVKGFAPRETIRLSQRGGGENYVHGGISLQEMVVPIIVFKYKTSKSKGFVEQQTAGISLLCSERKISNLMFRLQFLQDQPVGEKTREGVYSAYMVDENDSIISDRQTIIADRTGLGDSERLLSAVFNLKALSYDRRRTYRLIIEDENGSGLRTEHEFVIDIAMADDFGF